jgi:GT2 family glycosyltransferase
MVDELGLAPPRAHVLGPDDAESAREPAQTPLPGDLDLRPIGRWPTVLDAATVKRAMRRPLPPARPRDLASARPDSSIIVVTCENLVFTRLCLESVLLAGDLTTFELIVIDNGSSDGTDDYLDALVRRDPRVRVELGADNLGFPAAANRGLAAARGRHLILLNNDTIVAPGWLTALTWHLRDPRLGLICAVSNRAATEAQLETGYETYEGFRELAARRLRQHARQRSPLSSLTLFCAGLRRELYDEVGPLDERFGLGMFEDDDYVRRVRQRGLQIACAEDAYVHHFGQASIGWLARTGAYGALFAENRRRYDEKWAARWRPHRQRHSAARAQLLRRARELVEAQVPGGATVLVVSKGDDELLDVPGRTALHFPQDAHGAYAGFHPPDAGTAIAELERLRMQGATHLLIPRPSLWWLDHYGALSQHLEQSGSLLGRDEEVGALYALGDGVPRSLDRRAA